MRILKFFLTTLIGASALAAADLVPLLPTDSLEEWKQPNGTGKYRVEDGVLFGTTIAGSPNSFLGPKRDYGDFILEFDVLADPRMNSGVQIRSHQYSEETTTIINNGSRRERTFPKGRVHGYQVEISNEERASSGGVFDEGRRGWIASIVDDPVASKAFRDNEWNHYRVEAVGDRVRTWINGVACADLVDPLDQTGFIGFQVHAFRDPKPATVRWRNIRIADLGRHVWQPIFDGTTLEGWHHEGDGIVTVEDGAIRLRTKQGGSGILLSDANFVDFTVRLKYKMLSGNSGVFFRRTDGKPASGQPRSYEIEVALNSSGGLQEPGRRPWIVQPTTEDVQHYYRPGDWNGLAISAHGSRIVVHVNGERTVDLVDETGRRDGRIGLQINARRADVDVWYKDLEILRPE